MLRTKAMREKEEQRERRKYNYTLLRIRLPDGNLLQGNHRSLNSHSAQYTRFSNGVEVSQKCVIPGTFYAWDRLSVLFGFVRESLVDGWQPFELIAPGSQKLQESEEVALAECNLVSSDVNLAHTKCCVTIKCSLTCVVSAILLGLASVERS